MQIQGTARSEENKKKIEQGIKRLKAQGYTGKCALKNEKHERFCQEYLVTLNQTESAIRAGYSPTCAGKVGSNIMKDPKVLIRIEHLKQKRLEETQIRQTKVIKELEKIAMSNILDFVDVKPDGITFKEELSSPEEELYDKAAVIQEIGSQDGKTHKLSLKLYDKIQALDKLMRHMDLYERARLQIEREKLELMKLKNAPEEALEVGDDGFIEAMGAVSEENEEFNQYLEGNNDDLQDEE